MMVLLSFFYGQYGFVSVGSYCYSREWLWNPRTKLCCMAAGWGETEGLMLLFWSASFIGGREVRWGR